jgi:hypothetical protein
MERQKNFKASLGYVVRSCLPPPPNKNSIMMESPKFTVIKIGNKIGHPISCEYIFNTPLQSCDYFGFPFSLLFIGCWKGHQCYVGSFGSKMPYWTGCWAKEEIWTICRTCK